MYNLQQKQPNRLQGKLSAIASHVLLILAATGAQYYYGQQQAQHNQQQQLDHFSKQIKMLIEQQADAWQAQTRLLAQQPSLSSAATIKAVIPVDGTVPPSLSYAVQDLINRSRISDTGAELNMQGKDVFIDVASLMPNGGYLVAEWRFAPLAEQLKVLTPDGMQVRLSQQIENTSSDVLRIHSNGNDGDLVNVPLKLNGWQLSVGTTAHSNAALWSALITLLTGLLSLTPWLLRRDRVAPNLNASRSPDDDLLDAATTLSETSASAASFGSLASTDLTAPSYGANSPNSSTANSSTANNNASRASLAALDLAKNSHPESTAQSTDNAITNNAPDTAPSQQQDSLALADNLAGNLAQPADTAQNNGNGNSKNSSPHVLEFSLDDILLPDAEFKPNSSFPHHLFRAYDIRGQNHDFSDQLVSDIGKALGATLRDAGQHQVVLGFDARLNSPDYAHLVQQALVDSGLQVINVGMVGTPVMHYAAHEHDGNGIMITASHCAADQNGFKWVINNQPPSAEDIQLLAQRVKNKQFIQGIGSNQSINYTDDYQQFLLGDVILSQSFSICIDGMNGSMGSVALSTLRSSGCQVSSMNTSADGNFPQGNPDPTEAGRLDDLCNDVIISAADMGFAFDGDGDRLVVIDAEGQMVSPDQLIALFAQMILETRPGSDIIFDVKCSRLISTIVTQHGGRPIMVRSGNTYIRQALQSDQYDAAFGGEFSGHYFFNDGRGNNNDDGLYAALRLLEWLEQRGQTLTEVLNALPQRVGTADLYIPLDGTDPRQLLADLQNSAEQRCQQLHQGQLTVLDGIRLDFDDGFGIIRASNTGPFLTARFDGDDTAAVQRIRQIFADMVGQHHPTLAKQFMG